jgi:hypothetical protein
MTAVTTGGPLYGIIHIVIEPVVQLPDNLQGMGVLTLAILIGFTGVASTTGLRGYHDGHGS